MALTPVLRPGLAWPARLRHFAIVVVLATASLIPWTLRNVAVDGRWSPFADRSVMYIGILTDPRVGLYGVRYWEGMDDVAAEFHARYPDPAAREKAYFEAAWTNIMADPGWLGQALVWRALAFYGLLPDGYLAPDRVEPPVWSSEWRKYVFSRMTPLVLLPLTLVAVLCRPTAPVMVLTMAVVACAAIIIASAAGEARGSYASLPVHIIMIAALFATVSSAARIEGLPRLSRVGLALTAAAALLVGSAALARWTIGSHYAYRALMEPSATVRHAVSIDSVAPLLAPDMAQSLLPPGSRVRARMMVSNYMFPPKWAGPVPSVPSFASAPEGAQYFYGYPVTDGERPQLGTAVGVTFHGAELSHPVREGDVAEVEAVVEHHSAAQGLWLRVERARKLDVRRETLPAFP